MKKLKLKALSLGAREILNREQLRTVTGGSGEGDPPTFSCPGQTSTQACCRCDDNWNITFLTDLESPYYTTINQAQLNNNVLFNCGYGHNCVCNPW